MNILFATDRSDCSAQAAEYLHRLPWKVAADIHVLSVLPISLTEGYSGMPPMIDLVDDERNEIRAHLKALCAKFSDRASTVDSSLIVGPPGLDIVDQATTGKADLVVMGALGKSMVERVLLGSVSDYVSTHAPCSTLIVRAQDPQPEDRVPKRILVAIEKSEHDHRLLNFLDQFEWPESTEIHLVHVMHNSLWHRGDVIEEAKDYWDQVERLVSEHAESVSKSLSRFIPTEKVQILKAAHVGEAILDYCEKNECDLIITGDGHRGIVHRTFLGSTCRHILRHADTSVVVAR